jgi:hypothetical protein
MMRITESIKEIKVDKINNEFILANIVIYFTNNLKYDNNIALKFN